MRLFFGIEIPEKEKERIEKLKARIKVDGKIKWVERENLHITLIFLGEKNLKEVLKSIERFEFEPFAVSLKDIGVFPDVRMPKVLWIGVKDGKEKIKELYEKTIVKLQNLNIEKEKRFTPHLTIGRIKYGMVNYEKIEYESEIFKVDQVVLFASNLTHSGPIYEKIKVFPFGGNYG